MKSMFFDRRAVTSKTDVATRRVLSRFGAFVRTAARSSIRKRKKISAPASPPSSHTGLLKRLIYFGYDTSSGSVVIGPERVHGRNGGEAPPLLEYGGSAMRKTGNNRRRVVYRARPFMGPALAKERPKLPAMWAGSVKG